MPTASDLRYRVGFYTRNPPASPGSPPPPDYGSGPGYGGSASFIVWADIQPKLGGEAILAGRLTGKNYANITVRQSPDTNNIDPDWMCKNEGTGEAYNIRSIIDPNEGAAGHGMYWEMLCEKGVAI